jgi:hypothetical protein
MPMYKKTKPSKNRIMIGIPMTGLLRSEWVLARGAQVTPCNWSQIDLVRWLDPHSPLGFLVADARNVIATEAVNGEYEWLLFIDHDVVLPQGAMLKINDYMLKPESPIVSGLYFTKSVPSEPLIYRKRGTGYYPDWKMGDKVWVDGVPMGFTLIDVKLLRAAAENVDEYMLEGKKTKRIFETPSRTFIDPETQSWNNSTGTEDLEFCSRVIEQGLLEKSGWGKLKDKEYPFILDTSIFCRHIDFNGMQYPARGEELMFNKKEGEK